LLSNGSFESGNTGFATSYTTNNGVGASGRAVLASSPTAAGFSSANGIGAKDGTLALWANGSTAGATIWSETIAAGSLAANTTYRFYGYIVSANSSAGSASINVSAAGAGVGTPTVTQAVTTAWALVYLSFTTGSTLTGGVTLTIVDTSNAASANNFGLDFLSVPEPGTYAAGFFLVGAGFYGWRRHRRSLAAKA
jgi:hypothetical protein